MFKVNARNTRKRFEVGSKLTLKCCHWRRSDVFSVNFD